MTYCGKPNILNIWKSSGSVQISFTNNMLEREKSVLADLISRDDVAAAENAYAEQKIEWRILS